MQTKDRISNPIKGDIYHEFLSFFIFIVEVVDGKITTIDSNKELKKFTITEFKKHFSYKSIPAYWIDFLKNDPIRTNEVLIEYLNEKDLVEKRNNKIDYVLPKM